ncbi:hypothetical protein [Micromonospora sp. NPDC005206]|uniref:hypothetical protein n=1 Tax=Micromonospora sp. NPDC005206 TaxID=3157022 RepID=UPI0033B37009
MSPRAAWRLEAAGFDPVYDYAAGKADWLAADLPFHGEAQLVGQVTRRHVPTVPGEASTAQALEQLDTFGFGPVLVLNAASVVLGTLHREQLEAAPADAPVDRLLHFGVSTVRPSEQVADLTHRMHHANVTRVVVTRQDGTLVGLFFTEDQQAVDDSST